MDYYPTELATPEYPTNAAKQRAYTRYVINGESPEHFLHDVPIISWDSFNKWREKDDWDSKRADVLLTRRKATAHIVGITAAKAASRVFLRYVSIHDRLLGQLEEKLQSYEDPEFDDIPTKPHDLLKLSQALNACHHIGREIMEIGGVELRVPESVEQPKIAVQVNIMNAVQEQLSGH